MRTSQLKGAIGDDLIADVCDLDQSTVFGRKTRVVLGATGQQDP